uniref:Uncharacterized protein n=1 Tax=Pectobacterium carotovorum TaxID=554 RepID=A0A0N9NL95_PECCA|nr:Hypothetical protein [Pectobacterium carotovorum]
MYSLRGNTMSYELYKQLEKCTLYVDKNSKKDNLSQFMSTTKWADITDDCKFKSSDLYYSDNGLNHSNKISDVFFAKCMINQKKSMECANYVYQN